MTTSRTQFESWYQQRFGHSLYLETSDSGVYLSTATGNLFAAFDARTAAQVPPDYSELQRLAEACLGEWYAYGELRCEDRSGYINGLHHDDEYFIAAANPAAVLALLADLDEARKGMKHQAALGLKKDIERLQSFKAAFIEWDEKTAWVQKSAQAHELGMHRADALKGRIDQLKAEVEVLRKERDKLADDKRGLLEDFGGLL